MKVLVIPAQGLTKFAEIRDSDRDSLFDLQQIVGGYLEEIRTTRLVMKRNIMLVDEDGRMKNKPRNLQAERLSAYPVPLVGTAVIVGFHGSDWTNYHD